MPSELRRQEEEEERLVNVLPAAAYKMGFESVVEGSNLMFV